MFTAAATLPSLSTLASATLPALSTLTSATFPALIRVPVSLPHSLLIATIAPYITMIRSFSHVPFLVKYCLPCVQRSLFYATLSSTKSRCHAPLSFLRSLLLDLCPSGFSQPRNTDATSTNSTFRTAAEPFRFHPFSVLTIISIFPFSQLGRSSTVQSPFSFAPIIFHRMCLHSLNGILGVDQQQ